MDIMGGPANDRDNVEDEQMIERLRDEERAIQVRGVRSLGEAR